jgi:hypothetical protein
MLQKHADRYVYIYLALAEDTINLGPSSSSTIQMNAVLSKSLLQSCTSFPTENRCSVAKTDYRGTKDLRMVMGNFARDMMKNVSLRDTICGMSSDPPHDFTTVREKLTV